jgi:hypothetical protein
MRLHVLVLFLVICMATAPTALSDGKSFTNPDVIKIVALGIGDAAVIAKIRQAPATKFDLEAEDLAALKKAGVSGAVIAAMLDRAAADSRPGDAANAIRGTAVPEPDYVGAFFLLDQTSQALTPLERQTATATMEVRALGWGGAEGFMQVRGERSSVRIPQGQSLQFVVRVASPQLDPLSLVHLVPLEAEEGNRRLSTGSASLFGGAKGGTGDAELPVRASRYGQSSFLITPAQELTAGEYAFAGQNQGEAFCFGVDGDARAASQTGERLIPFRVGEPISLSIVERGVRIETVEVTGWPKQRHIDKATAEDRTKISLAFTYTNRSSRDYKCRYVVTILDEAGLELGSGEREAHLEAEEEDDTNGVGVSMRTLDFPKASKLRIQTTTRLE